MLALKSLLMGGLRRKIPFDEYPAHLHIDLAADFRRKLIGTELIEKFFQQCRSAGIPGIHLSTRDDNLIARNFFEAMGFKELNRYPMVIPMGKSSRRGYSIIYARGL